MQLHEHKCQCARWSRGEEETTTDCVYISCKILVKLCIWQRVCAAFRFTQNLFLSYFFKGLSTLRNGEEQAFHVCQDVTLLMCILFPYMYSYINNSISVVLSFFLIYNQQICLQSFGCEIPLAGGLPVTILKKTSDLKWLLTFRKYRPLFCA